MDTSSKSYRSRLYTLPEGVNTLLAASDPLLTLISTIKASEIPLDTTKFKDDLRFELKIFTDQLTRNDVDATLIRTSRAVIVFFMEQRLTQLTGKKFVLELSVSRMHLSDFRELVAQLLARKLDSLTLVEFIYVWLKTNPWVFIEPGTSKTSTVALTEAQDLTLILTDKLYRIIKNQRTSKVLNLLMGSYTAAPASNSIARRFNLGSPLGWLIFSIASLGLVQLGISLYLGPKQFKLIDEFYRLIVVQERRF